MRRAAIFTVFAAVAVAAAVPVPAAEPRPEPLVDRVRAAIENGVRFLRSQERDGNWERGPANSIIASSRPNGTTCLAVLALLNCGVRPDDPHVQAGLEYLRGIKPEDTYVVGLQTMVFAEAGDPKDLARIQRNVDWLIEAQVIREG